MANTLISLNPKFVGNTTVADKAIGGALANADGIVFDCPTLSGTHRVLCWFAGRGVDPARLPLQRYTASGTSIPTLTLTPAIAFAVPVLGLSWNGSVTSGSAA